ncbi:MAG: response regulator [Chloroflexi bacterium]|nr:response regulator [Chloroflexota bacterium]
MEDEPRFVYVDDDLTSREVMELLLTHRMGLTQCRMYDDSAAFAEEINSTVLAPDVIFMDIHMHPYNGFDMLEMLRNNEVFADTMIIAVTASVMNEEVERLREAGFDGAIGKPIDPDDFPSLVQRILNKEQVWHVSS